MKERLRDIIAWRRCPQVPAGRRRASRGSVPATLSNASWTCRGVACTSASGTGSIQQTLSLPANQQVTYTLTASVVSPAPAFVENMARLTLSSGAPHYVVDPDTADHIAIEVNLGDGLFRSGFESP